MKNNEQDPQKIQTGDNHGLLSLIPAASEQTGISVRSFRHLVATRQIPFIKVGSRVYLKQSDLDTLVNEGTHK